jgi:chemotaxis protein MotB
LKEKTVTRTFWMMMLLALTACGHTETEWRAQLGRYDQLSHNYDEQQGELARVRADLDAARKRAAELQAQLQQMGINVDSLSAQLQQTDTEKAQLAANLDQLKRALDEYKQRAEQLERIKQRFELLRDKLNKLTKLGLKVEVRNNRMVIRLPGDVLFPSGSDKLKDEGVAVLGQVAEVIRNDAQLSKRYFQVAGHTDNRPLQGGAFRDNWGLSLMRARQVLIWLIAPTNAEGGGGGLEARRLHAAGYGETDPVAPNNDDATRAANRRVELVLLPDVEEMLDLRQLL